MEKKGQGKDKHKKAGLDRHKEKAARKTRKKGLENQNGKKRARRVKRRKKELGWQEEKDLERHGG